MPLKPVLFSRLLLMFVVSAALAQPRHATFRHAREFPAGAAPAAAADFNHDGRPDVASRREGLGGGPVLLSQQCITTEGASHGMTVRPPYGVERLPISMIAARNI